ncbi:putative abhydrolase domain-containing protein [Abeliophyllum distichum]|uniref:Abhydrolase domain-containing protein n=1 Tax=Abeliophyllum distichum TaxID=126358 RepID=A0ABD1V924_9LAMI
MEGILPIRGVDGNTGETISIDAALSLSEADDPFRADVVRWAALDVPSIMVEEDLKKLREAYMIPADVELMLPEPNERACFSRRGCTALHLNAFVSGMCLPMHLLFRRILRAYGLAPTQTVYQPRKLPKKKGRKEEAGWYYFCPWGSHKPLVTDTLPRCELSRDVVDVVQSIYQAAPLTRSYGLILNKHRCLIELGLMASKAEMEQERHSRPTLAHLTKQRSRVLVPSTAEDTSQRKVTEDLSREGIRTEVSAPDVVEVEDSGAPDGETPLKRKRKSRTSGSGPSQPKKKAVELVDNYAVLAPQPLQRTLSVNPSGKVVFDSPPRVDPVSEDPGVGPFDSMKKLRELIGPSGDTLKNIPFFPSMGAQAVKKYFIPKWEEFASHGELEVGLDAAVRATSLQMKVLGEFRTRMQEHKKFVAEASKSDKEHQQALEGLQATVDNMRTAYEQLQAYLGESDSNVLQLTKQLDNANAAQKVAVEALEAANKEKRCLQGESESCELET